MTQVRETPKSWLVAFERHMAHRNDHGYCMEPTCAWSRLADTYCLDCRTYHWPEEPHAQYEPAPERYDGPCDCCDGPDA